MNRIARSLIIPAMAVSYLTCDILQEDCPGTDLPPDNQGQVTISQGVWGNVWFWEGNFQPVCPTGTVRPVIREIYIHTGTPHDSVEYDGPYIVKINTRLVKVVTSNASGFYQAVLDTGAYSFFIKEDSVFYFDGSDNMYLAPARVRSGKVTKRQLDITYKAAY
jgi:hypothetical protein